MDLSKVKKKWNVDNKPPEKKLVKKAVTKKATPKKTVKKPVKKEPEIKKETIPPSSVPVKSPRKKPPVNKEYDDGYDGDSLSELMEQAQEAKLREQISKAELAAYKVEKEALELKKNAGDLIETTFGEFLYFGYMERVNLDLLRMMKRVEPMIENMVNDKNTKGIIKRINSEITNILKGIQKQQAEDAKNWKKEL